MTEPSFLPVNPSQKESPNMILYKKMENLIRKMQNEAEGVPVKTVKSLLTKIPDVFSGEDVVQWLMEHHDIYDQEESTHLGSLIAGYGYFFPIDDHVITLKNDGSFYRFQSEYYWPSKGWSPENTEYAVYLCKRTMQNKARLELADYEAENLARLQRTFSKSWEVIFARAEQEAKNDRKKDKIQRKVFDSQERAFWDVHRPVPGCVNTTEVDIKKAYWYKDKGKKSPRKDIDKRDRTVAIPVESVESLTLTIQNLNRQMDRHCLKMSKVCESVIGYTEQQADYDPFILVVEPSNPWLSNDTTYWTLEKTKDISSRRANKWKFSFGELLKDEQGCEQFRKFLEKEFSAENLDFYLACNSLKKQPLKQSKKTIKSIFRDFLSDDTPNPINIDSVIKDATLKNMKNPDRYCFELAQEHIYHLMKTDSYARFLKSDHYKSFLVTQKPQQKSKTISSGYNTLVSESSLD